MIIRQSDLASWARCPQQVQLSRRLTESGGRERVLSATAFGTVIHHAVQILETLHHEGREDACEQAVRTFEHYWHSEHIGVLVPGGIDVWLPRQTYGSLLIRGRNNLRAYYEVLKVASGQLLALEHTFEIPIRLAGFDHVLRGTVDRLALRVTNRRPWIDVEDYKGLPLDTKLPTPTGWTTMGQVRRGDRLLGSDGRSCKVVALSQVHEVPCHRVTFDDGTSIVADAEHCWRVVTDRGVEVLTTEGLRENLVNPDTGQRHLRIPNPAPLLLPPVQLPVDPYVLGVWLGDGKHSSGEICKPDGELFEILAKRGYPSNGTGMARTALGLHHELSDAGLTRNKHIPAIYLRASYQQRLDLLRGLMDTDGSWHRKRRRAVFTTCDEHLANGVRELACTFGWRPSVFEVVRHGFGKTVTAWDVTFVPIDANCFLLSRKANLVEITTSPIPRRRLIVAVEPVPATQTRCVQVDSLDSLYLAGDQMVPTHNSGLKPSYLRHALQWTVYAWASLRPEFWQAWPPEDLAAIRQPLTDRGLALYDDGSGLPIIPRRGHWIALREGFAVHDCGWRVASDFARMRVALAEYASSVEAGIYPLSISGATCTFCPYAYDGSCGGIAISNVGEGEPYAPEELCPTERVAP